jgi:hypothetical protein
MIVDVERSIAAYPDGSDAIWRVWKTSSSGWGHPELRMLVSLSTQMARKVPTVRPKSAPASTPCSRLIPNWPTRWASSGYRRTRRLRHDAKATLDRNQGASVELVSIIRHM